MAVDDHTDLWCTCCVDVEIHKIVCTNHAVKAREHFPLVFRSSLALALSVGRGDTPVTRGSWILDGEEDSIDRSFTVLVEVVRRCLPAPPPRARWPNGLAFS